MSKKDYQAIARGFHELRVAFEDREKQGPLSGRVVLHETERMIANILAADNPRFSRERFAEACETGRTRGMRQ